MHSKYISEGPGQRVEKMVMVGRKESLFYVQHQLEDSTLATVRYCKYT